MKLNKIYVIDCLDGLKQLPDNSVDFVFTDPPYNVGKDYGAYQDNLSKERYLEWLASIIRESARVSNNKIAFFVGYKILREVWNLIPDATLIIVQQRAQQLLGPSFFLSYYGLLTTAKPSKTTSTVWSNIRLTNEGYFCKEKRFEHPAKTSDELTEKVIKVFTKTGDLVLDPFMGTGTTAVICKMLKRNFLGFEINPKYCTIAEERLSKATPSQDFKGWFL